MLSDTILYCLGHVPLNLSLQLAYCLNTIKCQAANPLPWSNHSAGMEEMICNRNCFKNENTWFKLRMGKKAFHSETSLMQRSVYDGLH